jgi:CRISPR-associated protein Csm3
MAFQLRGRIILQMDVHVLTGLHVGGAGGKVAIGGVDSPVIRDPITSQPYLPGSSVRGKMRSLVERVYGREQNMSIGQGVRIHMLRKAEGEADEAYHVRFRQNETCSIFGVTGDEPVPHPTALIVRDAQLGAESVERLKKAATDLPFTEVKWEATIDRVTSAATPRQVERVPAGAVFEGLELVYSIYEQSNLNHLPVLFQALTLVEEDYLGGPGARGSGKVRFELTKVVARQGADYRASEYSLMDGRTVNENAGSIVEWVQGLNIVAQTGAGG